MPYANKMPSGQMSKVSKAPIVACLTCPLCGNLFREATTISECLHTFCKECIHERFSDDEVTSCPMCNVSLGCLPLEKLRADPQLDDVQAKIFKFLPRKPAATGIATASAGNNTEKSSPVLATPPVRRKERSLSSLGVVSVPSTSRSRRAKQKAAWVDDDASEDEEEERPKRKRGAQPDGDDESDEFEEPEGMYCSETLESDSKSADKTVAAGEPVAKRPKREARNKSKQLDSDFLSPLACLAELADADEKKFAAGEDGKDEDAGNAVARGGGTSLRATKNVRRKPSANGTKNQPVIITSSHTNGLWFSLAPQTGEDGALPQISTPYLRIKDGKVPVSYVKKYVAKKLDLKSEAEVEITCLGQPVVSSLPLESVRKIWLAKGTSLMRPLSQRSVGKEFLMVLTYGRNKRNALPTTTMPPEQQNA